MIPFRCYQVLPHKKRRVMFIAGWDYIEFKPVSDKLSP